MNYQFRCQIQNDDSLRKSFNDLAFQVFQLDFEPWYQLGYWTQRNIPYVLVDQGKVIANVSCNPLIFSYQGKLYHYLQIGTVMTDPDYRGQGLSRYLLEKVLSLWQNKCDAIYLYANETVLDFYPKFGFVRKIEKQMTLSLVGENRPIRKLNMDDSNDVSLFQKAYQQGNPYSVVQLVDNFPLLMYYCSSFLQDQVFYDEANNVVIMLEQHDQQMFCYDIFGQGKIDLRTLLKQVAHFQVTQITLGFIPIETTGFSSQLVEDETLFLLASHETLFDYPNIRLPFLSHT